jgi:hypothetical protein
MRNAGDDMTDEIEAVERAVARMRHDPDPRQRKVIIRYYLSHMNHQDIADRLGLSEKETKLLHLRSLSRLGRLFDDEVLKKKPFRNRMKRVSGWFTHPMQRHGDSLTACDGSSPFPP